MILAWKDDQTEREDVIRWNREWKPELKTFVLFIMQKVDFWNK